MRVVQTILLFALTAATALAADEVFPMQKGDTWTYRATVRWTVANSNRVGSSQVTWKSEVIDTVERGDIQAALLLGFVADLAWWDPDNGSRGDWLIVRQGERYFLLHHRDAIETFRELQKLDGRAERPKSLEAVLMQNPWFRTPLQVGNRACEPDQEQRTDRSYCWFVESSRVRALNIPGVPARSRREFELIYRTNPEHEIVTVAPGVGVTSYEFAHHGTVAEASARLVRFEHAKMTGP